MAKIVSLTDAGARQAAKRDFDPAPPIRAGCSD
jgi:hypothetical protein